MRIIVHIDMNAFYAAVEERYHAALQQRVRRLLQQELPRLLPPFLDARELCLGGARKLFREVRHAHA